MIKPAFEIVTVEPVDGKWLLQGRAWETIRLSDILTAEGSATVDDKTDQFIVVAITTYGHVVDELYRMMTGSLTVSGQRGDLLLPEAKLTVYQTTD